MARIEGTGIKSPSRKSIRLAGNLGPSTPVRIDNVTTGSGSTFKRVLPDFGAGRIGEVRLKKAEADISRPNFFSPGGGAFDSRNDVQVASANLSSLDVGDKFTKQAESNLADTKVAIGESGFTTSSDTSFLDKDSDFNEYKKTYGGYYESFPGRIKKDIKLDYLDRNPTKYQQFLNKAPVQEKPSFVLSLIIYLMFVVLLYFAIFLQSTYEKNIYLSCN